MEADENPANICAAAGNKQGECDVKVRLIWDDNLSVAGVPLSLDNDSLGVAAQAGVDVKIGEQWSFNVDVKWATIRSDVKVGAATLTQARLDPLLYAVGATYRF